MKVPFYLLGLLLRNGPQHGYKLMQMIEERISDFAKIKLSTVYYHLQKLDEQGYIIKTIDKDGNRPEKYIYTITDKGMKHYELLYSKLLSEVYLPEFAIDGVLYYSENVDTTLLLNEFKKKRDEITNKINKIKRHKESSLRHMDESSKKCAELIFEHHIGHLEAEYVWLEKVIKGLYN